MKPDLSGFASYSQSPAWAERLIPRTALLSDLPGLILLRDPEEACWVVASSTAADLMSDPRSVVGGLLRAHGGLMGLRYLSNN